MNDKEKLEDLFINSLDIEKNLIEWVKRMVKYGNMFDFDSDSHGLRKNSKYRK